MKTTAGDPVLSIFEHESENPDYLKSQLITYIGNKRSLLPTINRSILRIREQLGGRKLRSADLFSGSGVVSRLLKQHSSILYVNDLENYARYLSECFLANQNDVDLQQIETTVNRLNRRYEEGEIAHGFIREMYAPADESNITPQDRVFYTIDNAQRLDSFAQWAQQEDPSIRPFLIGPLMSKASIHTNTAGVFKGFYKNPDTRKGQFGGKGSHALARILGKIHLETPVLSNFRTQNFIHQTDSVGLSGELPDLDFVYLDPPYNQHPYGANYFMLDFLHHYVRPEAVSDVSGIPVDWNRSDFNVRSKAATSLEAMLDNLKAAFILISFNDEGFISPEEMRDILSNRGVLTEERIEYNTYRGSRNLRDRSNKVTEHLFLLRKA